MAEISTRRVVLLASVAGALVGGVVAGGVAELTTTNSNGNSAAASTGSSGSLTTARVVRTTLTTPVQVGGSISYDGSYSVAVPSGYSPQQVAQAEQAVTQDEQSLSADEQSQSNTSASDNQQVSADQTNVDSASASLAADKAQKVKDCAGNGASAQACSGDAQKVSQDESQLTQAQQQLAAAQLGATRDYSQGAASIQSDETRLAGDEATLSSERATETNPGTTFTYLPRVGALIKEDDTVYSLGDAPVPLLYGSITAYRAFYVGMPAGPDVGELTHDLIALGYGAGGLKQSDDYSPATATAVKRWQKALRLAETGEILLGGAVFEPGPIRVTTVDPAVGASLGGGGGGGAGGGAGGGTVLTATGTTPIVTVDLDVSDEYLVKPGDAVSIVLPNGSSTVGGHVESVGTVATCPGGGGIGNGGSNGAGSADQSPCAQGGSNGGPTVPVIITMDSDPAGASLDQAPVNVDITAEKATNVLAVPVNALLALQGGGYGVEAMTSNGTTKLVGVTTGLYGNTLVEVSGPAIRAGTRVEVPSS